MSSHPNTGDRPLRHDSGTLARSLSQHTVPIHNYEYAEQECTSEEIPGSGIGLEDHGAAVSVVKTEEMVIKSIRATDLALGLGRLPVGFYASVYHSGLEWRTENKPVSMNSDVIEWSGPIPMPSDLSSCVCLAVQASFEFQPMLGDGQQLRKLTVTVEKLVDHSAGQLPFTFHSTDDDVVAPCSSLLVTVSRRNHERDDLTVLASHRSVTEPRGQLTDITNRGQSALLRYRNRGERRDLEDALKQFQDALNICPMGHPCYAAALSNMAMANFICCQASTTDSSFHEPLTMYRNALTARPVGHPDRPFTLIQLATVHLVQFEKQRDEDDASQAKAYLAEVMDLVSEASHERCAATLMLQMYGRYVASAGLANTRSSVMQGSASSATDMDPGDSGFQLLCRYERFGDLGDLQKAISHLETAIRCTPIWDSWYPIGLGNLGVALSSRFKRLGELSDLEEATSRQRDAVGLTPDVHPDKPSRLNNLGNSFLTRFRHLGQLGDLEDAILRQWDAVNLTADHHPGKPSYLNNLGISFLTRFKHLGQLSDLEEAISCQWDAVEFTPDDHPDKPTYLSNLGNSFQSRFERLGQPSDLEEAISLQRDAVSLIPDGHPYRPKHLNNLGNSFLIRFRRLGQPSDLESAISQQQDAVNLTPDAHPDKPSYLNNLGTSFLARFEHLGQIHDLEEVVSRQRVAVDLTPDNHPERPTYLSNLGCSTLTRFEHLGQQHDLEEAILRQQGAVNLTPGDHPRKSSRLNSLGTAFHIRFKHFGQLCDLEEAISQHRDAVNLTPDDHPDRPGYLSDLGTSFRVRFERLGQLSDLEEAISCQRDAVNLTPDNHPNKPERLDDLGSSFLIRFKHLGQPGDLEDAISQQQDAVDLTPDAHSGKRSYLNNLSISFLARFEHLGRLRDLEDAISRQRDAVNLTPHDHPNMPSCVNNLGNSFRTRFEHLGQLRDLEDAISRQRDAVDLIPDNHPDGFGYMNNLGNSLRTRFERLGQIHDLDDAISRHKIAIDLTPDNHPERPSYLSNFGSSLRIRFEHLGQLHDLEEAISRQQEAVSLTVYDHPNKPSYLCNLSNSFHTRFDCLGQICDLEEAILRQQDAINLIPNGNPLKPRCLTNLGNAFLARFDHLKRPCDLEEAISRQQDAIDLTPDDHPDKPAHLASLGNSFLTRFEHLGERSDIERALVLYSNAARAPAGPITIRFHASRRSIYCARLLHHPSLLSACSVSIHLLPRLAWIGLSLADRYRALIQGSDVVREAAAVALDLARPETAVEWLEQGRSVVWEDLFQLRSSYDELSSAYPDHACRLRELSVALEWAGAIHEKNLYSQTTTQSLRQEADKYRALAIERDSLLRDIRTLPGFERFLLHKEFSQLRASAHSGPVVILNATESRCDALIVLADVDHVIHVPLPNFSLEKCKEFQSVVLHARSVPPDDRYGYQAEQEGRSRWEPVLASLWKCVVRPVLDALALSTPGDLSHVFWCPTGPLTFLPIHAAGFYGTRSSEPGHKVFDFVVSSYVPTLGVLSSSSRSKSSRRDDLRLLAVRQPLSDGQPKLAGVHAELESIKAALRNSPPTQTTVTEPSEGTVEEVLELMKNADWVHFACHGVQDDMSPSDSGLCLADKRRLRISDIIALSRPHGGLAFLSACQTAKGDKDLSDEAIHIAAGMLFAGFGGVVGTMWSISDDLAPAVAKDVYEQLFQSDTTTMPDSRGAARALHYAVGRLRERKVPFGQWLPFIHLGL